MEPENFAGTGRGTQLGCRISFTPSIHEPTADTRPHDPRELMRRLEQCNTRPLALPTLQGAAVATMTRAERRASAVPANNVTAAPLPANNLVPAPMPAGPAPAGPVTAGPITAGPVTAGPITTETATSRAARRVAARSNPGRRGSVAARLRAKAVAWLRQAPQIVSMIVRSIRGWLSGASPRRRITPKMIARPAAIFGAFVVLLTIGIPMGTKSALTPETAPGASLVSALGTVSDRDQLTAASRAEVVRRSTTNDIQDLEVSEATNQSVTLSWLNPELGDGESIQARRVAGKKAVKSIKDGAKVDLPSASSTALVDSGLVAGKSYSYALFVVDSDGKARLSATTTAQTRKVSNYLAPGDVLRAGQQLVGQAGGYTLRMTAGGDVQLRDAHGNTLWSTGTDTKGAELHMLANGNLAVVSGERMLWQTESAGHAGARLTLEDDGDIAIVKGKKKVWSRHDLGNMVQGDDYPWPSGYGISVFRYALRNCTDFAAWRLNVQAGRTHAPWAYTWGNLTPGGGNANQWAQYYPNQTDTTPKLGAVAWWSGHGWGSSVGHVAIVSAIWPDGSITVEEYNVVPLSYGTRHLYPGTPEWPEKFLHIHDL